LRWNIVGIETFLKACTCEARLSSGAELKPHIIWWAKLELARRMMYNISNSHYPDTINPAQIKMIYDAEVRREPQENG